VYGSKTEKGVFWGYFSEKCSTIVLPHALPEAKKVEQNRKITGK
jgi:hypothetical protein